MMQWTTACRDWQKRVVAGESLIPCVPLFPDQAAAGLNIFRELRVVDIPGSPKVGDISRPFALDFVASIFGAYDQETGRRLIREWFFLVSKKNWKSGIAAGVMMTALILNWRRSGEFGILAPTIEAANNAFRPARDMIREDEELSDLMHVQEHIRTITHRTTGATLQVVAADSEAVAGKKWIGTLVDELWLFGKKANADRMLLEATGGMASRPEGFVIYLSTHSDEAPAGVFKQKLQYARGVRDGRIDDPEFMPILYEFPPQMIADKGYMEEANWHVTNPNLGASVDQAFIRRKLKEAQEGGEETLQIVLAKHLNVEIGLSLASDRWAGAEFWERCASAMDLDALLERSEVVVVGIDGGGLDDLLGLSVMGREKDTGRWLHWAHAWAHQIALTRRKENAPRMRDFEKDGDLTIVASPGEDVRAVADIVCRIEAMGLLPEKNAIGVDAAGIGDIIDELTSPERGIRMEQIIAISQGWRLNGAIKTAERKVAGGELSHCGSKLMAWCVGNAKVEDRGNAIAITKQASGKGKIDPLMATFDAVSLLALNPQPNRPQLFV